MHRPHYKIKKRLASICRQTEAIRLMAIEAIADDEARAYLLTFLNQIEDFAESAHRVVEVDRQKGFVDPQKSNVIHLDEWRKAITEAAAKGEPLDLLLTKLAEY